MRMNRQRVVPTVFSIYMLDVICCALGCVILLWQLKYDEADQQADLARRAEQEARLAQDNWRKASTEVTSVTAEIDALKAELAAARKKHEALGIAMATAEKDRDEARRVIVLRKKEYDELRQAYLISEALLKDVRTDLGKLKDQEKATATALAAKVKANAELLLQITAAEKKTRALEKESAARKLDAEEAARRLREQLAKLKGADAKNTELEKAAADLRAEGKDALAKLTASELRVKMLEQELERNKKDLTSSGKQFTDLLRSHETLTSKLVAGAREISEAKATITLLQGEKAALTAYARTVQAEAEQRFAGIALTGKNVLFLVDMSGSMAMIDENTLDPDKWPLVCETVVQLMRSIKGLQYYQIILFSDKLRYPMGSPAAWLKYDARETPGKVLAALKAVTPENETNMHAVFAEAFRYREAGCDTMYVLSDGLPNAAEGVPLNLANMTEAQRTEVLSKDLRARLKQQWNRPIAGQPRVRINTIGFFFESPDVGAFLWALAREHSGSFVGMSK